MTREIRHARRELIQAREAINREKHRHPEDPQAKLNEVDQAIDHLTSTRDKLVEADDAQDQWPVEWPEDRPITQWTAEELDDTRTDIYRSIDGTVESGPMAPDEQTVKLLNDIEQERDRRRKLAAEPKPPYPWCMGYPTIQDCIIRGFCRRNPSCGD